MFGGYYSLIPYRNKENIYNYLCTSVLVYYYTSVLVYYFNPITKKAIATKTIYLEKETEQILLDYCNKHNLSTSKAINTIVKGINTIEPKKPVKSEQIKPNIETKNKSIAQILAEKRA